MGLSVALGASETNAAFRSELSGDDCSPNRKTAAWTLERIDQLKMLLLDERFSVREEASRSLMEAPPRFLPYLRSWIERTEVAEFRHRLTHIARRIFLDRVLPHTSEWRVGRGFLGIQWEIVAEPSGIRVIQVLPGTAAERGGLRDEDVLIQVGSQSLREAPTHEGILKIWRGMAPGDILRLKVVRDQGLEQELRVTVGEAPRDPEDAVEEDHEKAESIWRKYLAGELRIPAFLLAGGPEGPLPTAASGSGLPEAVPAGEGAGSAPLSRTRLPLQSWPKEDEAVQPELPVSEGRRLTGK